MKMNAAGIALLKQLEGLELEAYQDSVGVWTIGYGLTSAAGLVPVTKGMRITKEMAEEYLVRALQQYEDGVFKLLKRNPTSNQFSAMVSFAYNVGVGNFSKSLVLKLLNEGNIVGAGAAFNNWTKAGGKVLKGLIARRKLEEALFLRPDPIPVPVTPAPVEPPVVVPPPPVKQPWRPTLQQTMTAFIMGVFALITGLLSQCSGS